jgi:hypothetical protein
LIKMNYFNFIVLIASLLLFYACADDPVSPGDNGFEKGAVTDIDDNVYETILIGEQWWMAENLRVARCRNGDEMYTGLNNWLWGNIIAGAYSIYLHYKVEDGDTFEEILKAYGELYNCYAAA